MGFGTQIDPRRMLAQTFASNNAIIVAAQTHNKDKYVFHLTQAHLAQSVERTALNRVVVGSIPTVGAFSLIRMESRVPCPNARGAVKGACDQPLACDLV